MFHYITEKLRNIQHTPIIYLAPVFVLGMLLLNAGYVSFPDEFVNALGGKYILAGKLPYSEYFDHHLPLAWYLSALFLAVSFGKFVIFRYVWALFMFAVLFGVWMYLKQHNKKIFKLYNYYFLLYPFIAVYYWLHLFVADSLAVLFFSASFWLILSETYTQKVSFKTLTVASLTVWALVFSSMTFAYLALGLYAWMGYLVLKEHGLSKVFKLAGISALPYVLYGLYILATGRLDAFIVSNITYNTELYINLPNYTRGAHFNPIKFILTLMFNFIQHYIVEITEIKNFDFFFPVTTLAAFATFLLIAVLLFENPVLAMLFFFILALSAPRSNVREIAETNYQAGVYLAVGFISSFVALWRLKVHSYKDEFFELARKVSGFLLLTYMIFASMFLVKNTFDKAYQRYTQVLPGIYDMQEFKELAYENVGPNEIFWAGPFEPHQNFYFDVHNLPGKYPTLLPQFRESEYFSKTFMEQFKDNPPALIVFKHGSGVFGTPADEFGEFFLKWVEPNYTTIDSLEEYSVLRSPTAFQIGWQMHIRNDILDETLQNLIDNKYIEEVTDDSLVQ